MSNILDVYDNIEKQFQREGFDLTALNAESDLLLARNANGNWEGKKLEDGIRFAALPLAMIRNEALCRTLQRLALEVIGCLPQTLQRETLVTPIEELHVTVFHTGRPEYLRPMTAEEEAAEWVQYSDICSQVVSFSLEVDRVVMAPTGTLLLLLRAPGDGDPLGGVGILRKLFVKTFSDAPEKQARILHCSVARVAALDEPLPTGCITAVQEMCNKYTSELKEEKVHFTKVWAIREDSIPLEGPNGEIFQLPLGRPFTEHSKLQRGLGRHACELAEIH